jgi:hypothetical protein
VMHRSEYAARNLAPGDAGFPSDMAAA